MKGYVGAVTGHVYTENRDIGQMSEWRPQRHTQALIDAIVTAMNQLLVAGLLPIGPRGIGYRLLGRTIAGRVVMKDGPFESLAPQGRKDAWSFEQIRNVVNRARRRGLIPWEWVSDNRSGEFVPNVYADTQQLARALAYEVQQALPDPMRDQTVRLEVWSEARDLMALIGNIVQPYGIHASSSSGWSGPKACRDTGQRWAVDKRPLVVLSVGDLDPDGLQIPDRTFADSLAFATGFGVDSRDVEIRRIAVTEEQAIRWDLPREGGKRSHRSSGISVPFCVQAEAIPPELLRDLLVATVESTLDADALADSRARWANDSDRQRLTDALQVFTG